MLRYNDNLEIQTSHLATIPQQWLTHNTFCDFFGTILAINKETAKHTLDDKVVPILNLEKFKFLQKIIVRCKC